MATPHASRPVLLIDDSMEDLFLTRRLLARAGVENPILTVNGGEEAITFLDAAAQGSSEDALPIVVYCDVKMPAQSGFDVLAWVRKHELLKELPFYMLSGADLDSDKARAQQMGANGYIAKFPTPAVFRQTIQSLARESA